MNIIPTSAHPSNLDKSAKIATADRNCEWTIYSVRGGYILTLWGGRAVEELFPSQQAAQEAITTALEICPPGDGYPVEAA